MNRDQLFSGKISLFQLHFVVHNCIRFPSFFFTSSAWFINIDDDYHYEELREYVALPVPLGEHAREINIIY